MYYEEGCLSGGSARAYASLAKETLKASSLPFVLLTASYPYFFEMCKMRSDVKLYNMTQPIQVDWIQAITQITGTLARFYCGGLIMLTTPDQCGSVSYDLFMDQTFYY